MVSNRSEIKKKRVMILGPTASGKTELAHRLALEYDSDIISVDSRQCYKRIDIGTAKPGPDLLNERRYFNISILELTESDSVADFRKRAGAWAKQIRASGRPVIYAGGSTLHLQSIIEPLDPTPRSNPENIRYLEQKASNDGLESLYNELTRVDPVYADAMDGLNRQRILRALDVWMQTGKPFSSFHTKNTPQPDDDLLVFGLDWPRKILHERINNRVDRMIRKGLIEETRQILDDGFSAGLQSLQTVGYRDVISYFNGNVNRTQMIADIKTQTRRYAKRQITWFRKWPFIHWMDAHEMTLTKMLEQIQKIQHQPR